MQNTLLKAWGIQNLNFVQSERNLYKNEQFAETTTFTQKKPIIKLPLQFTYLPVEIISKELTKLNSKYKERIIYLGPRWNNSFHWHKKYSHPNRTFSEQTETFPQKRGYYFNQRRVQRNNSFIHDSMRQNRFFKNQAYYRAFEGMNPTIDEEEIVFESRFQSGNLDCAVKIKENEYDLFLRIDTNTKGHIFWYYFTLKIPSNSKMPSKRIKLNICNITKSKTLYERNLKPYIKRTNLKQQQKDIKQIWTQGEGIANCKFKQKKLKYSFIYQKIKPTVVYQLSFEIQLRKNEQVSLAYCIPYTYSDLVGQLYALEGQVQEKHIDNVFIGKIGESLTGVSIPVVVVGNLNDPENADDKKIVFITGRAHPGESNSSLILSSLINQLCLKKNQQIFSDHVIFVIVPMINPDGVILGNGRCSALGKDLNRQFKSWNSFLNPEVVAIKKIIDKIQDDYEIEMYFDFHGHSKKKNMFFFGPNYSLMDPNYYKCRVFPKILSKNLDFFRYYGCTYTISSAKNTTARAVMLNEFNVPFFYTVETSVGFLHDYSKREDVSLSKSSLIRIGIKFKDSLKEYFEGIEEYESFIKGKKKQKNQKIEPNLVIFKPSTEKDLQKISSQQQKLLNLKLVKVFEQIKTQLKNSEKIKKAQNSQTDSDSCRASQELQTEKSKQFTQMIVSFNKIEEKKLTLNTKEIFFPQIQETMKQNQSKRRRFKHHSQTSNLVASLIKKLTLKIEPQFRIHSNTKSDSFKQSRNKDQQKLNDFVSEEERFLILKPPPTPPKTSAIKRVNELNISAHNFFRKTDFQIQLEENEPVGFVNFSKFIQNPKNSRYSKQERSFRLSSKSQKRRSVNSSFQASKGQMNNNIGKYFFPFGQQNDYLQSEDITENLSRGFNGTSPSKPYPSSFYRIKYQTSHKKCRNKPSEAIGQAIGRKDNKIEVQPEKTGKNKKTQIFREPQKLFINISKISG